MFCKGAPGGLGDSWVLVTREAPETAMHARHLLPLGQEPPRVEDAGPCYGMGRIGPRDDGAPAAGPLGATSGCSGAEGERTRRMNG